jgi:hypothetical protein
MELQPFLMPTWPRRLIDEIERRGLFFVELAGFPDLASHWTTHAVQVFALQDANLAVADCDVRILQTTAFARVITCGEYYGACLRSGGFIRSAHSPRLARRASSWSG